MNLIIPIVEKYKDYEFVEDSAFATDDATNQDTFVVNRVNETINSDNILTLRTEEYENNGD